MITIERQAELQYPMPLNACTFTKMRIAYLRERFIKEKTVTPYDVTAENKQP